jgi:hypothetical protein
MIPIEIDIRSIYDVQCCTNLCKLIYVVSVLSKKEAAIVAMSFRNQAHTKRILF